MMRFKFSFFLFLTILLTSCIEIIDDITINEDGSGTFNYSVNLSSSKVKINSILALDSLDGKKVPSIEEITRKLNRIINNLKTKEGISNVQFSQDYTNFIFKLSCDFSNVDQLQKAIKAIVIQENHGREIKGIDYAWISYQNNQLIRSVPKFTIDKVKKINSEESQRLKEGKYTSITRFEKEIKHFENKNARLSKNKKAIMVQTNIYTLIQTPQLLNNVIFLIE